MKIYLIMPVRNASPDLLNTIKEYVTQLENQGHQVHFPPRDVNQNDPTGFGICQQHLLAMQACDKVAVYWDNTSTGSHFDLGMAFALGKPVDILHLMQPDSASKSYIKVMQQMTGGNYTPKNLSPVFSKKSATVNKNTPLSMRNKNKPNR